MSKITRTMLVSAITNTFLSIAKIVTGLLGKSGALVADGVHSFSDLITDLVAIIGGRFASKPADKNHPYGHGRVEYLTSMVISVFIILLGVAILIDVFTTEITRPETIVVYVTIFIIIAKLLLSTYILRKGKQYKNSILISSGYESRTDVISSSVVLVSAITANIKMDIFKYSDKVAMFIVGLLIIKTGFSLLKENVSNIIGEDEKDPELRKEIEKIILNYNEVIKIDKLLLIKYGEYYQLVSDIQMDENKKLKDVHDILEKIEKDLTDKTSMKYISLHVNPHKNT